MVPLSIYIQKVLLLLEIKHMKLRTRSWGPLFENDISSDQVLHLDLSADKVSIKDNRALDTYIQAQLQAHGRSIGIGGYLEQRGIYQQFDQFEVKTNIRNIHLGVDVWLPAGTPVFSPCDGKIHSSKFNAMDGDYGGTIIVESSLDGQAIHLLFGHLSKASVSNWPASTPIHKGACIGQLGDWDENVGWPPHLHFQLIKDMGSWEGDYPGVCSVADMSYYKDNCPSPIYWE